MAKCKNCGKKGLFLSLSSNGLCKNCNPIVVSKVTGSTRIIQDCQNFVENSKNLDVRLGRLKLLLEQAEILLEFENKKITTIEPLPSEIIKEYTPLHDKIIIETTEKDISDNLTKAKKTKNKKTKINYLKKAISKLEFAKKIIDNKSKLIIFDEKINNFIDNNKLEEDLNPNKKKITKSSNDDLEKKIEKIAQSKMEEFQNIINNIDDENELLKLSKKIFKRKPKMKDQLTNSVIEKITGYKSLKEIATLLNINSDSLVKSMKKFHITWFNTSESLLSQRITDLSAGSYRNEGENIYYQYFGSLVDDKTRPACRIGLGADANNKYPNAPLFTEAEKELFESEFGIRWNCRHAFNLITERYYRNMINKS